jgi:MFS family permease
MLHFLNYFQFISRNRQLLSFGFVMLLGSSLGQTFFIGVFGPAIRGELGLSHTSWSAIYMAGTLMSALVLPWTGQRIDRIALPRYAAMVIVGLAFAAAFTALVPSALFLIVAIFLLRQTGQGLMSHTGSTAMARYFPKDRGKAMALASIGTATGEAVLPVLMVVTIAAVGWRTSYGVAAAAAAVIVLPVAMWLLRGHQARHRAYEEQLKSQRLSGAEPGGLSRRQVLHDSRFYLLLPAASAPSFISTALFFHHLAMAELKGWDVTWFTGSYWVYALGTVFAVLAAGPLIDRLSAVRVLPAYLVPMTVALFIVWAFDNAWWAWGYLFLVGVTSGVAHTGLTALWAEVYGVKNLGAIKSLFTSISVFASALGPLAMGFMMDQGVSIENICIVFAAYCLVTSVLLVMALRRYR